MKNGRGEGVVSEGVFPSPLPLAGGDAEQREAGEERVMAAHENKMEGKFPS
jgi:hypothetical protein